MSETINNREYRQRVLKELIGALHQGQSVAEVTARFREVFDGVSATEIAEMEQALIAEGMPAEEIQRLCDVHASVFAGAVEPIPESADPAGIPGHPLHTFKRENREMEKLINEQIKPHLADWRSSGSREDQLRLLGEINLLWDIDKHYSRKENLLFPYLEKYGITAPPKVMWGVDDEIRRAIKEAREMLTAGAGDRGAAAAKLAEAVDKALEMISKEENILFPMAADTLSEDEWLAIAADSDEIGYCLTEPAGRWRPVRVDAERQEQRQGEQPVTGGYLKFETGIMTPVELEAVLNRLPVDLTFVDKAGVVRYFNRAEERVFARTKAVIGRQVQNCHPPASVHIVEKLVEDLQSGRKEHEDFWIRMGETFVYIRYFAVRDEHEDYLGTLEVTQNIKPIQAISGEKRLVSEA